jgi:hypothetical protein
MWTNASACLGMLLLAACQPASPGSTAKPKPPNANAAAASAPSPPTAAGGAGLSQVCTELTELSELDYDDEDDVAEMLAKARACAGDRSLLGRNRAFVTQHFPPPAPPSGPRKPSQHYYAGNWQGDGDPGSMAFKQVKLIFCFDAADAVREVRAAYVHQDMACPP